MTEYKVGNLIHGDFATYSSEAEALVAWREAVEEGAAINIESIGEEGCAWTTEQGAREAAESLIYIRTSEISIGAAMAALRKTETKPCVQCGTVFSALIRKTHCERCRNNNKVKAYLLRKKTA